MDNNVNLIKVSTDDYEVLYVNGKLTFEGHSLNFNEVIEGLIDKTISSFASYYVDEETMEEEYHWDFPSKFEDFFPDHLN